jgi:hypothetical protein
MATIFYDYKTLRNNILQTAFDLKWENKSIDKDQMMKIKELLNGPSFEISDFECKLIKFLKDLIDELNRKPFTPEGIWIEENFGRDEEEYQFDKILYRRYGKSFILRMNDFESHNIILRNENDMDKLIHTFALRPLIRQLTLDQLFDEELQSKMELIKNLTTSYFDVVGRDNLDLYSDYENQIYWSGMTNIWSCQELYNTILEQKTFNTDPLYMDLIDDHHLLMKNRWESQTFQIYLENGIQCHNDINLFYEIVAEIYRFDFNAAEK